MLKKRKIFNEQRLWRANYLTTELDVLIHKSLLCNFEIDPTTRYRTLLELNTSSKYKSKQKLRCFVTLAPRVPNSRLGVSRYYMSKHSDNLLLSGLLK